MLESESASKEEETCAEVQMLKEHLASRETTIKSLRDVRDYNSYYS
jgi:hypothetical protein